MAEEPNTEVTPEPEVVVTVPPDGAAPPVADPAIKDLAEQYKALEEKAKEDQASRDAAMARAEAAEKIAQAARRDAHAAREAAASSNLDTITTAQASAQAALDAAKQAKKAAREAGDYEAESEADDRLMQARIDLRTYDEAKANIEARKSAPPPRPSGPATETEIVDAYIANRTQPTAEWLRNHKDYILDGRKNAKLTAAHHDAIAEGLQPDTQKYFDHVEKFVGLKKNDDKPVTEGDDVQRPGAAQAVTTKKPIQRSVAPVNGASGTGGAVSNNTVTLSQREATAATDGTHVWNYDDPSGQKKFKKGEPIGLEEFARRKQKLTQQGAYDRTYETQ